MSATLDPLTPHINAARQGHDAPTANGLGFSPLVEIVDDLDPRAERGRYLAAMNVRNDPEVRKLMEDTYGKPYCRFRYPEAYEKQ